MNKQATNSTLTICQLTNVRTPGKLAINYVFVVWYKCRFTSNTPLYIRLQWFTLVYTVNSRTNIDYLIQNMKRFFYLMLNDLIRHFLQYITFWDVSTFPFENKNARLFMKIDLQASKNFLGEKVSKNISFYFAPVTPCPPQWFLHSGTIPTR